MGIISPEKIKIPTSLKMTVKALTIEQAATKKKGVRVSRKDFVNWLIEKSPDNLSGGDLNSLIERFYDEASFLRQLLREVQQAKKEGQTEPALEFIVRTKKTEQKKETNVVNDVSGENISEDGETTV